MLEISTTPTGFIIGNCLFYSIFDHNGYTIIRNIGSRCFYVYIDTNAMEDLSIPPNVREKYIVSKEIGRGAYEEVKLCFIRGRETSFIFQRKYRSMSLLDTCDRYAMKIIAKKHFTIIGAQAHTLNQQIQSECSIHHGLDHPCIIRAYDVYDTPQAVYIILELVEGGELFDRVVATGQFDERTSKFLFRQMCLGVKYLHDRSITHRDLKPENVLLTLLDTNETLAKITDFGLSKFINETSLMKTFCGTPNYLAPEVLSTRGEASYSNKVDVWSLGVILYICLVGYPPFTGASSSMHFTNQAKIVFSFEVKCFNDEKLKKYHSRLILPCTFRIKQKWCS